MKIKISDNIFWNTEDLANSDARQWIGARLFEQEPQRDRFGRPVRWVKETDTAVVTVEREYVNPDSGSWAKRKDIIIVKGKGGDE